ncbi:MAG: hypothetical protein ACLRFE_00020 [Clostridia bacterium]
MFIEDLWKKNPELVKKAVKKICEIEEDSNFGFRKIDENGKVEFVNSKGAVHLIKVGDFDMEVCITSKFLNVEALTIKWMKFMKSVYGCKYLYHYIAHRNEEYDKYVDQYEIDFNSQTKKILNKVGMPKHQDELTQTK